MNVSNMLAFPSPIDESFGMVGKDEVEFVLKAIEAQENVTDSALRIDGGALQPQSLESSLNHLTWRDQHLVLWNLLKNHQEPARSTVEEYAQRVGYGQASGYTAQMENPAEADPSFVRRSVFLKFLRQQYKYSDVSTMVNMISPAEREAKESALKRLMSSFTQSMYRGDSTLIPEQVDGFETTILNNGSSNHVLDLRGAALTQQNFADLYEQIVANYGGMNGLTLLGSTGAINQLGSIVTSVGAASAQRWQYNVTGDGNVRIGNRVSGIDTQFGPIEPIPDLFLGFAYESSKPPTTRSPTSPTSVIEGQTALNAPKMPSNVSLTVNAGPVTNSQWANGTTRPSGTGVGQYSYRVAAGNRFGLSQATALATAGTDVTTGGSIDVVMTPAPGDPNPPTFFVIYSEISEGYGASDPTNNFREIGRVARGSGATTTFTDLNEVLPGYSTMFLMDLNSAGEGRSFGLRVLGNIHSLPLAKNGAFEVGLVNFYYVPIYYQPLQYTMLRNVNVSNSVVNPFFGL